MVSLETWIGLRYLRAKKRNGFMSFITMISIIGIALGVTALITVLSVMNGFQKEIRGQLLNVAPHAEIGYYDNGNGLGWQNLREIVKDKKEVLASAPYISDQALHAHRLPHCRCVARLRWRSPQVRGRVESWRHPDGAHGSDQPARHRHSGQPGHPLRERLRRPA